MKKQLFLCILTISMVAIFSENTYAKKCFDEAAAQAQAKMVADGKKLFKGQTIGTNVTQIGHTSSEMGGAGSAVPEGKTGNIYVVVGCTYLQVNGLSARTPGVKERLEVSLDSDTCDMYRVDRKNAIVTSYGCFNPGKGITPEMDPEVFQKEYLNGEL